MAKYKYKVKDAEGNIEKGEAVAEDRYALSSDMRAIGKSVISIEEVKEGKGLFSFNFNITLFSRVRLHDKIIFSRNLSSMVEAGLPLSRALGVLERQAKSALLKKTIKDLLEGVTKGQTFSEQMAKHPKIFSNLEISMVRVGEESGNLADSLDVIATQMEKVYTLRKKIKSAMMYPGIIMSVMLVIGALMMIFVVPTLIATFEDVDVELPTSTKIVIATSNLFQNHLILLLAGAAAVVIAFILFLRTGIGKRTFDFVALHTPIIGTIVKEYNTAQSTRTLSSLLSSGVGVVETINITYEVLQNSYYKDALKRSAEEVQKGIPLSETFTQYEKLYPAIAGEMVQVGEETGQLSDMLTKVADYYEEEVNNKTKDMSTIIEPFLMVIIGIGVGFFAVSMLTPMYSLVGSV